MKYNVLIGGAAGQGMDTISSIFEWSVKYMHLHLFSNKDYMSRVRGGHNFVQIHFGDETINAHTDKLDVIIALNDETIQIHKDRLSKNGLILCSQDIKVDDDRSFQIKIKELVKEIGNPKVGGTILIGALMKAFGFSTDIFEKALSKVLKKELMEANLIALKKGYEHEVPLFDSQFKSQEKNQEKILVNGNTAIALGAINAGVKFYSAYPMTPSTSIMTYIAKKSEALGIVVEQAEDEIAGINMAIGASYAGVRAMTGTSGGGYCLKVEAVSLAGITEIPIVIANIQRPGPATGLPTRTEQADLKFIIHSGHGEFPKVVIACRTAEDSFYATQRAFNLADQFQIPVIILGDQFLADANVTIEAFDVERIPVKTYLETDTSKIDQDYKRYQLSDSPMSQRIVPGKHEGRVVCIDSDEHDEYGKIIESSEERNAMNQKRLSKIPLIQAEMEEPWFFGDHDFQTLLICWGSTYGAVKDSIDYLNQNHQMKLAALCFGDVWPLPVNLLKEKSGQAKKLINIEQNATGQLASIIREVTGIAMDASILKSDGRQISPDEIIHQMLERGDLHA
jgi:2-oxoglutarate ferredoxin oxidoreductase subunit alpha